MSVSYPTPSAPRLPQSCDHVIDISKIANKKELLIKVPRYICPRINDTIIVSLNEYISSLPLIIRCNNIYEVEYTFSIPFSSIPLGEYEVFYTIFNWADNRNPSDTFKVKIIDSSSTSIYPPVLATSLKTEILANGTPANGYTPNSVLITAFDEESGVLPGVKIDINSNDKTCVTPSSVLTDQNGQAIFSAISDIGGISSVNVSSGDIKYNVEFYFSPVTRAKAIIVGSQSIGNEYEIITIKLNNEKTSKEIKNSPVYYKIHQAININSVFEINSNKSLIQSMVTDEYGQFNINLKGKSGGSCTIFVTADNCVGNVKYTKK
ncbi:MULTISPECIES: Ig-like domain-containing protein [Xenorhabdus]|uniref:Ig-like domain-containing protein n=1 Tax=Xenorhabdus TaxID=626 RepID=UPI001E5AE39C|nr:Ig-like domain-containing protein [Xenorhabdus sp. PB30.3]MCC8379036.1 Ig-like domain-containing protein [Xenorhabdus sp. PB30.3]